MIRKNQEKIGRGANLLKICIFLVAILFFVGQVNAEIGVWCEGPNEDNVTVCKSIDQSVVRPDGTAKMRLNVTWQVVEEENRIPADVVFAIDSSGSMRTNDPDSNRIKASKIFVDRMKEGEGGGERYLVGLVSWDYGIDGIDISEPLTNDFDHIEKRLKDVDAEGETNLNLALRESFDLLNDSPRKNDPTINRSVILLTDGKQKAPEGIPIEPIDFSIIHKKIAGKYAYKIYTIGLGSKENISEPDLERIAKETGGVYRYAENASVLIPIYEELARVVLNETTTKIKDITITDILHNYIKVKDDTFSVHPTTGPKNPDGTTTMVWKVKKKDEKEGYWESSFNVLFDFSNLPVDVNQTYRDQTHRTDDISIVTYTVEGTPKRIDIPSGRISIGCPPLTDRNISILSVSTTLSPPNPSEGQKATITAIIKNIGNKEVRDVKVGFYADSQLVGTGHVDVLKPGDVEIRKIDWRAREGAEITAKVDITSTSGSAQTPVKKPTPGFETIFAIAALLAVAYLGRRRRRA